LNTDDQTLQSSNTNNRVGQFGKVTWAKNNVYEISNILPNISGGKTVNSNTKTNISEVKMKHRNKQSTN